MEFKVKVFYSVRDFGLFLNDGDYCEIVRVRFEEEFIVVIYND